MVRTVMRQLRGTNAEVLAYTGFDGQVVANKTTGRLHLMDGVTPGGIPHARLDESPGAPDLTPADESLRAAMFPLTTDTVYMPGIRRRLRLDPDPYDWGLIPGVTTEADENADKWDTMMAEMRAAGLNRLYIPPGNWMFDRELVVDFGLAIFGDHMSYAVMSGRHNGNIIRFTGQYGLGASLSHLSCVYSGFGDGNIAVYALSSPTYSPDFFQMKGVNISHLDNGKINYPLLLDGNARAPASGLVGLRNVTIEGCTLFNAKAGGGVITLRNARAVTIIATNCYQGGGDNALVYAGGSAAFPTSGLHMVGCIVGDLALEFCSSWSFTGGVVGGTCTIGALVNGGFLCAPYGGVANANPGGNRVV